MLPLSLAFSSFDILAMSNRRRRRRRRRSCLEEDWLEFWNTKGEGWGRVATRRRMVMVMVMVI